MTQYNRPPTDTLFTFTPDRKLLQPLFNSYKLRNSSDEPSSASFPIPKPSQPRNEQVTTPSRLSYAEVQARAKHNRLTPGKDGNLYYIDQGLGIVRISLDQVSVSPTLSLPSAPC